MANPRTPAAKAKDDATRVVESQREQYIIAPRRAAGGIAPQAFETFSRTVSEMPGVDVVKKVRRPRAAKGGGIDALGLSPLSGSGGTDDVLVVSMEPSHATLLGRDMAATGQGEIHENRELTHGDMAGPALIETFSARAFGGPTSERELRFRVTSPDDKPIEGARVVLTGDAMPREGTTNARGEVAVKLVTLPGGRARALHVSAARDYWDCYLLSPTLQGDGPFGIELQPIRPSLEVGVKGTKGGKECEHPAVTLRGWGQDAMGLGGLTMKADGRGVKVAVVDSGIDTSHPLLGHVAGGVDLAGSDDAGWREDGSGHGTHVAGVIGARPTEDLPFRGVVPGAELHSIRVFPGAREHMLLEAIDYCIANDIDVVNMSLGSDVIPNEVVEEALHEAVDHGIAVVVATGNSSDGVKYPAMSGFTYAVGAVGHIAHVPQHGSDRFNIAPPGGTDKLPIFAARFSCHGPQVNCASAGVATVSCALGDGLVAMSGTSMAAPQVAGLAALLLAHHPDLAGVRHLRGRARVEALFGLLTQLCHPLLPLEPAKVGAGLPRIDETVAAAINEAASAADGADDVGGAPGAGTVPAPPLFTFAAPTGAPVAVPAAESAFQAFATPFGAPSPVGTPPFGTPGFGGVPAARLVWMPYGLMGAH